MGQINLPDNWIDEKRDLQRQIDELRAAVGLSSATISRGGLTIKGGAFFKMLDASGNLVVYIGADPGGGLSQVFQLWRPAGQEILFTQQDVTSGRYFTAIRDWLGNIIFADDVQTGGLARPYLEMPMVPAQAANYQTTTSASFVDLWVGEPEFQHPKLDWSISVTDSLTTSGQVRVTVDGVQLGTVFNYAGGTPSFFTGRMAHGVALQQAHTVRIQALRTTGTGVIAVAPYHLRGVQS